MKTKTFLLKTTEILTIALFGTQAFAITQVQTQAVPMYTFEKPVPACPADSPLSISSTYGLVCRKLYCPGGTGFQMVNGLAECFANLIPTPCPTGSQAIVTTSGKPYCASWFAVAPPSNASSCPGGLPRISPIMARNQADTSKQYFCGAERTCPAGDTLQEIKGVFLCRANPTAPPAGGQAGLDGAYWYIPAPLKCSAGSLVVASNYPQAPASAILAGRVCVKQSSGGLISK